MSILLVSLLVPAVLLLLLVLIPTIALQMLLRLIGPPPARRTPAARNRKERAPRIQDSPTRSFGLFRIAS
jgi:hypothetical protein